MLYADDFVLMAESEELLMEKLRKWKKEMEAKGLGVNADKTKVMQYAVSMTSVHCRRCLEGENGLFQSVLLKEVVVEPNVKLECVPKFCYE